MKRRTVRTTIAGFGIGLALFGGEWVVQRTMAQSSSGSADRGTVTNDLQRSQALFNLKTAAPSGPQRAEEIYYIKCWICHNRRTWIDNSTDPVTVWYVDNNGYIVRIQPLE